MTEPTTDDELPAGVREAEDAARFKMPESVSEEHSEGLKIEPDDESSVDEKLALIEMAGEEVAAGWRPDDHKPLAPEVRFLHCSRTIHQLITDRNRSVGIFLLVASVLVNASTGLIGMNPPTDPIVPMAVIRRWCLPFTFGSLAILGIFTSLLLIRARIGLIYEVTKMNVLLGLPSQRVERVNPLSIFYLMHLLVATLGGASAGLMFGLIRRSGEENSGAAVWSGVLAGALYALLFQALYYITILRATSETKLSAARK